VSLGSSEGAAGRAHAHFADRLAALVEERSSQIVLGLDPDPANLWPEAIARATSTEVPAADRAQLTAEAVAHHCRLAIAAAGPSCVAVKPQLACFERLGSHGWAALEQTVATAHEHGLLVIADAKRGDISQSARAYGQALVGAIEGPFGQVEGLGADAFTANALLGRDAIEPMLEIADAAGAGCFVLVRTSNPGAAELQDQPADEPLRNRLARIVDELGAGRVGACGLSDVGAVAGATHPELLADLRQRMPRAIFLLPGVGAQGGKADDVGAAFAPHPAGGLIASSRSIVDAHASAGGDPALAAAGAAEALRITAWRVATSAV
jgi:orotidine-5'-phosphate decarboxylase